MSGSHRSRGASESAMIASPAAGQNVATVCPSGRQAHRSGAGHDDPDQQGDGRRPAEGSFGVRSHRTSLGHHTAPAREVRAFRAPSSGVRTRLYAGRMLVSERIGQFFVDAGSGRDRLEYTEYGAGDQWVVLIHGQLMPRRMHQPLARSLASQGLHVVTLDLLGHGRSDRPSDPLVYSMTAFAEQVVALLDHLDAPAAVIGGTSLGANVSLEVADIAPERVRGLIIEMPVLDNAVEAGILAFATADVRRPVPALDGQRPAGGDPADPARHRAVLGRASSSTPSTSALTRSRRSCTACSSAGSRRRRSAVARSPHPRWWSVTRRTRSTRPRTPRCWPRRCPTRRSCGPGASWSGGSGPSGSTTRPPSSPSSAGGADALCSTVVAPPRSWPPAAAWVTLPRLRRRRRQAASGAGLRRVAFGDDPSGGRLAGCLSTATRRSCCAPTSSGKQIASSPC